MLTIALVAGVVSALCAIAAHLIGAATHYGWDVVIFCFYMAAVIAGIVCGVCILLYFIGPWLDESRRTHREELVTLCLKAHEDWTRAMCEYDIQVRSR